MFDMTQAGMQVAMKFTVVAREGSKITFTASAELPGMPPDMAGRAETQTIDASDPATMKIITGTLPDATGRKVGEETIAAAGRDWACQVYEVEGPDPGHEFKMKLWRSDELLPIFNGGAVKRELEGTGPDGKPEHLLMQLREVGTAPAAGAASPGSDGGATPRKDE